MSPLYEPLSNFSPESSVRLLTLLPASSETDPISCTLRPVELAAAPPYESLSYCWGDASVSHPITCNGHSIPVTLNLEAALRHLRRADEPRVLWIDAICINQDDLDERSSQVVLMRDIYRRTRRVVVWLGPAEHDSPLAFKTMKTLSGYYPEIVERFVADRLSVIRLGPFRDFLRRLMGPAVPRHSDIESDPRFKLQPPVEAALRRVMQSPWWTRLWVVQEVCMAEDVIMVCGHDSLSWDELSAGLACALGPGGLLVRIGLPSWLACCINIWELKTAFHRRYEQMRKSDGSSKEPVELKGTRVGITINMLQMTRLMASQRVSVPHDRVYGVVGLAPLHPGQPGPSIVPDYQLPLVQVYQDAALAILKDSGNLDLLRDLASTSLSSPRLSGLPSWVPDWSHDPATSWEDESWGPASPFAEHGAIAVMSRLSRTEVVRFSACPDNEKLRSRVVNGTHLLLEGHVVDTIATVGPVLLGTVENDGEETWRLFGEERHDRSLLQRVTLFAHQCLRTSTFMRALLAWEDIAFADPARPRKDEQEAYLTVLQGGDPFQSVETSVALYEHDWRGLWPWLRRLSPLKVFGSRTGALNIYNLAVGFLSYLFVTRSASKSHLVTVSGAIGDRIVRTTGGRLAKTNHLVRAGDSISLLRGGRAPYVVRPRGDEWEMVGSCYVHDIMHGEAWRPSAVREMEFV